MKNLVPPPTEKELEDLKLAIRGNITAQEYVNNEGWYANWAIYLIGLRRAYQKRFLAEAYNEFSSST